MARSKVRKWQFRWSEDEEREFEEAVTELREEQPELFSSWNAKANAA